MTALAAGCGDDDDAASTTTTAAPPSTAATSTTTPSTGAFPATVEHALGTTVVEESPQRVVTVGVTEQDSVLAVDVTPVGVTDWYGDQPFATWPWAQDELGDAEPTVLVDQDGLDYEGIAALDPDLIVGTNAGLDDESYGKLSAIAPTIAHAEGAPLYFSPWDDQVRLIGAALGKDAETDGDHRRHRRPVRGGPRGPSGVRRRRWRSSCRTRSTTARRSPTRRD